MVKRPKYLETKKPNTVTIQEDSEEEDWLEDMKLTQVQLVAPVEPAAQVEPAEQVAGRDAEVEPADHPLPDSTDEEVEPEDLPGQPVHREVAQLKDSLSTIPDKLKRTSVAPDRLEMERAGEASQELE